MKGLACLLLCGGCELAFPLDSEPPSPCGRAFAPGVRHVAFDQQLSWFEAETVCESLDPDPTDDTFVHLAVVSSIAELAELRALSLAEDENYVGLTNGRLSTGTVPPLREEFEWLTLEETVDVPWHPDNPDSNSSPPLGGTFNRSDSLIHDTGSSHAFICECDGFAPVPERVVP